MIHSFSRLAALASLTMWLASCATIYNGGNPLVVIEGDINEPVTVTTSTHTYTDVTLPVEVQLSPRAIEGQRIQVSSANHEFEDIVVEKKTKLYTLWNTVGFVGIPGMFVDWATNSNVAPRHSHYLISPKGEGGTFRSTEPFRKDSTVTRPHAMDFYRHEVSLSFGAGGTFDGEFTDLVEKHVESYGYSDWVDCLDGNNEWLVNTSLDYIYNFDRRLGVGLSTGRGSMSASRERWMSYELEEDGTVWWYYTGKAKGKMWFVMPTVRYKWWIAKNNRFAAYSQAALGWVHTDFSVGKVEGYTDKDAQQSVLLPACNKTGNRLGYQFTFAGIEMGRGHLRCFLEIGTGYKGYLNGGLRFAL